MSRVDTPGVGVSVWQRVNTKGRGENEEGGGGYIRYISRDEGNSNASLILVVVYID